MRTKIASALSVALLMLAGFLPASGVQAQGTPPAPKAIMVEGSVVQNSNGALTVLTPARGMFCKPPMMCPDLLMAGLRYKVESGNAQVFSNYLMSPGAASIHVGSQIVVYGTLLSPAQPSGGAEPWKQIQTYGLIDAQAIFVLSAYVAPYPPRPIPMPIDPTPMPVKINP